MYTYPFEKLQAWHGAHKMVVRLYEITAKFPAEERYGLTQQLRRAAVSVSSNLSEGSGRFSAKDQGHFYSTAYSSLMEALNQILIAKDLGWVSLDAYEELRGHMEGLSAVITALRKSILSKQPPPLSPLHKALPLIPSSSHLLIERVLSLRPTSPHPHFQPLHSRCHDYRVPN